MAPTPMQNLPSLAIIIVSWNVRDMLRRCLRATHASLAGHPIDFCIIVVDNASDDGTPTMIQTEFPDVQLLQPGRNLGFAAANNLALRHLGCPDTLPDMVLLLNPDTEPQGDAIPRMLAYLHRHPKLIVLGPQLRYPDGTIQSSERRFPTRMTFFWESTPLERWWPSNPWVRAYRCATHQPSHTHRVDWLVGAALLVRGHAILRAGLLDERFFLYSEEVEWQYRLQQTIVAPTHPRPSAIHYFPEATIVHYEAQSSSQRPAFHHIHFQRSRLLLAALWYGNIFATCLRFFLVACYTYDLLIEALKHLLHHRPVLRRERIRILRLVLVALRSTNVPPHQPLYPRNSP